MSEFNYVSARARKARLGRHIAGSLICGAMLSLAVLLVACGLALVFLQSMALGWLIVGLAAIPFMASEWGKSLRSLPADQNSKTIDGLTESNLLGLLTKEHTPRDLAAIVMKLPGGRFFIVRYGLPLDFLTSLTSANAADSAMVWQEAERLRQWLHAPLINASILTAALLRTVPGVETPLANFRLGVDDITIGASWYMHLEELAEHHRNRNQDGGIGRDWSFGYTPLLSHFGFNISEHIGYNGMLNRDLPSRRPIVSHALNVLSQGSRHNIALVGQLGSGKTTLVHTLAQKMLTAAPDVPHNLHYRQVISLDPSILISQASGRGELEGLLQRLCHEALSAKNIILFLDDAHLFFEEGTGSVNVTNVLLPIIEGGALPLVLAMDEQAWLRIAQSNPALAQHMNRVIIPPTDEQETMAVMQDQVVMFEHRQKVTYMYQALETAYRLSGRYLADQAMPGKALKLLDAASGMADQGFVTHRSVEQAIEQTQGVKVGTADSEGERQTLLNLEKLIHERMINQTHAVQVVSDALRRARAGVRNTNRPIGTFLFLGPTGVGKTELAKSVAAVFFGGEDHLVRIDLNEYVGANDVTRLIADGAQDSHSLTAQISRNPFAVVLLDEIEKAHPNVLNTLLQLLDEGILRDINNREVSFRDAVIIATSNAGADRLRQHIEAGEELEQFEQQFTDELINSGSFRPEFLNRFDEIVLFRPLKLDELSQVIDLIIKGVNKNLAAQKISVVVDDDAKQMLVKSGYDPRLGARPMRRIVQRVVENIVANQMLTGQAIPGTQIHITAADVQTMLQRK